MAAKKAAPNKFAGADELYLTGKRIVKVNVRSSAKKNKAGQVIGHEQKEVRSNYAISRDNLKQAQEINGGPLERRYPQPAPKASPTRKAPSGSAFKKPAIRKRSASPVKRK